MHGKYLIPITLLLFLLTLSLNIVGFANYHPANESLRNSDSYASNILNNGAQRAQILETLQKELSSIAENLTSYATIENENIEEHRVAEEKYDLMKYYYEIKAGDTLKEIFSKYNISENLANLIIKKMSGYVDFKKCRPGDKFWLTFDYSGRLESLTLERGEFEQIIVLADKDTLDFKVIKKPVKVQKEVIKISGVVNNNLFESFNKVGLNDKLTIAFAEIFASKIDFNRELRQGDKFSLIVERYKKGDEIIGYGRILAARYVGINGTEEAFLSEDEAEDNYYDPSGNPKVTSFLKSPLPIFKVTSKFSYARKHPLLNVTRPHLGVDLAAPVGTPVRAVADGEVIFAGYKNGFGNTVIIKHANGYETSYAHLQKLPPNIKKGVKVKQKDLIGFVGTSGIATGPHLDFRVTHNGKPIDPLKLTKIALTHTTNDTKIKKLPEIGENLKKALSSDESLIIIKTEELELYQKPKGWLG